MTEAALRALVREVVARQLGIHGPASMPGGGLAPGSSCAPCAAGAPSLPAPPPTAPLVSIEVLVTPVSPQPHVSHAQFALGAAASGTAMPCVIEPAVPCDHCGYCKSLGH